MDRQLLLEHLRRYLEERPHDLALFGELRKHEVGAQDFTDDVLDSFTLDSRMKLYASMLIVYRQDAVPILRHRIEAEERDVSKLVIRKMIQVFEQNPDIGGGS